MNKRKIAKIAADHIVIAVATTATKKALTHFAPSFADDHETVTKVIAAVSGYAIADQFEATTHKIVDRVADKIQARKSKKTQTPTTD